MPPRVPEIRSVRAAILDSGNVLTNFRDRADRDLRIRRLSDQAQQLGGRFEPVTENVVGYSYSVDATQPIRPLPGQRGAAVNTTEFEIQLQQYPSDTADKLAVGIATARAGDNSASYPLLLEAPNGEFLAANEYTVIGDRIEATRSWWTAITGCLTRQCVTVCANSLTTCWTSDSTWLQYAGCIAWNCGGCWLKCLACATCDCSWWCKWAAGCCSQ